ncbi:hypothetical protein BDZ88DRAFT_505428 [Geranomyces variabilis]|nr:hypothetical protein BDZ88DRAFT_505428 [Geranomyces variabilis]KAJ3136615.1 transcriptional repressor [Geranomyces variabilis]
MAFFGGRCAEGHLVNLLNDVHSVYYAPATTRPWMHSYSNRSSPPPSPVSASTISECGSSSPARSTSPSSCSGFSDEASAYGSPISTSMQSITYDFEALRTPSSAFRRLSDCSGSSSLDLPLKREQDPDLSGLDLLNPLHGREPSPTPSLPGEGEQGASDAQEPVTKENPAKRSRECPTCGNRFTTAGHLSRHMRIHSGVKPFKCLLDDCPSKFSRQDNMMQHYRTHVNKRQRAAETQKSGAKGRGQRKTKATKSKASPRDTVPKPNSPRMLTPPPSGHKRTSKQLRQETAVPFIENKHEMPETPSKPPKKRAAPQEPVADLWTRRSSKRQRPTR